jgi:hypothetical protein
MTARHRNLSPRLLVRRQGKPARWHPSARPTARWHPPNHQHKEPQARQGQGSRGNPSEPQAARRQQQGSKDEAAIGTSVFQPSRAVEPLE